MEGVVQVNKTILKKWGPLTGIPKTEEESQIVARGTMISCLSLAPEFVPDLLNKVWLLVKAHPGTGFFSSDNPVALHNTKRNPFRGNLGIAVTGIEIYLPLSHQITLAMFCRSHLVGWHESRAQSQLMRSFGFAETHQFSANDAKLWRLIEGAENGTPIELTQEQTDFQNELQIWNSSRFIFSRKADFDLAKEAIRRNPDFRQGPKMVTS